MMSAFPRIRANVRQSLGRCADPERYPVLWIDESVMPADSQLENVADIVAFQIEQLVDDLIAEMILLPPRLPWWRRLVTRLS